MSYPTTVPTGDRFRDLLNDTAADFVQVGGRRSDIVAPVESLEALNLEPQLLANVKSMGMRELLPAQKHVLAFLHGSQTTLRRDLMCQAPTGSGKTRAYMLAAFRLLTGLHSMMNDLAIDTVGATGPIVLIIQPTREQSEQVFEVLRKYAKGLRVSVGHAIGGLKSRYLSKRKKLNDYDVLIGTPGRLLYLFGGIRDQAPFEELVTDRLKLLVLDDADVLFGNSFKGQMRKLKDILDTSHHRVAIFSACFSSRVQKRFGGEAGMKEFLEPHYKSIVLSRKAGGGDGRSNRVPAHLACVSPNNHIHQTFLRPKEGPLFAAGEREALLASLLRDELAAQKGAWVSGRLPHRVLVFVERKLDVDKLIDLFDQGGEEGTLGWLQNLAPAGHHGYLSVCLHSGQGNGERREAMEEFCSGRSPILIATSVAARGLDIEKVQLVVNYDMPRQMNGNRFTNCRGSDADLQKNPAVQEALSVYVQRIGRSGRVGNVGRSVSFVQPHWDSGLLPSIRDGVEKVGKGIEVLVPMSLEVPPWMEPKGAAPLHYAQEDSDDAWEL